MKRKGIVYRSGVSECIKIFGKSFRAGSKSSIRLSDGKKFLKVGTNPQFLEIAFVKAAPLGYVYKAALFIKGWIRFPVLMMRMGRFLRVERRVNLKSPYRRINLWSLRRLLYPNV